VDRVTGFGAVDPAQILTEGDLRQALAQLVAGRRHSMRAVERETGVSKTTMYEMLKGSRQLRHTTFTKIINFYAAEAADAWQAAWHRVHADGRSSASAAQSASVSARPETARRLVQLPADTPSFTGRQDEAHRLWSEALDVYDALGVPDAEAIRGRLNDLDPAR